MQNLLIVSPRFPPKNAPDLHRARMSLPYFRNFGWDPTVLCLTPETSDGVDDALLAESLPKDIDVVRVDAWSEQKCRRFGFGHLDYRCLAPLYNVGRDLLKKKKYDVVLFSTTVFLTFLLGPIWKRRFGSKIVYDFQDPWYQGESSPYTRTTVPGRWWKYRLGQFLARYLEPFVLRSADHIISVSPGYVDTLSRRYPWLPASKFSVIPFGVEKKDFEFARDRNGGSQIVASSQGVIRWVSVGRAGPDMDPILSVLFEQLAVLKSDDPSFASQLRVHFIGTNYSPSARTAKVVEALACRYGVGEIVQEHSERIPYHEALHLYAESDAVLLIGSSFSDYTASKLFNCVLSRKPILALFHEESLVSKIAANFASVFLGRFKAKPAAPEFKAVVAAGLRWLRAGKFDLSNVDRDLAPWLAEELTRVQCAIFDLISNK